jgi:hypothetical protein
MKESTKSASFVTTTRISRAEISTILSSVVRFPSGRVEGVNRVVPVLAQPPGEVARKLRIDEELHAASGSIRFTRLRRVA